VDWRQVFKQDLIYLVYGGPLVGKTRLAVNIADADLKAGRRVVYVNTELNNKPILNRIKPHVGELIEEYDAEALWDWARGFTVKEPTTVIVDSLGGLRLNYIAEYGVGGPPDTVKVSLLVTGVVHNLAQRWMGNPLKVVLLSHESPAFKESFHGEDGYPTSAWKAIHDVSLVVRLIAREVTEGGAVRVERVGKIVEDRYGIILKNNAERVFNLPEPLF
jgi:hypothetical protein